MAMASFCLQTLLLLCLLDQVAFGTRFGSSGTLQGGDDNPAVTPLQFLIVSSPSLAKVSWTAVSNMQSTQNRTLPLIDDGLTAPKGLAFDHKRGFLYVADSGAEKIYRFTVIVKKTADGLDLDTSHVRVPVAENCGPVEWVTVDDAGNLFYSSPKSNNINKITYKVMQKLASGQLQASALKVVSEKTIELYETARNSIALTAVGEVKPTDAPEVQPNIYSIYEAELNPRVSQPGAIWADGADLYWTNRQDGKTAGTVVKGQINPKVKGESKTSPEPFPADILTDKFAGAIGIAKTDKNLFFIRNDTVNPEALVVSVLRLGTDVAVDLQKTLQGPRAMTWDHDATIYVADELAGKVLSFPSGRLMSNAPLTTAVSLDTPFGVAVLSSQDPCFAANAVPENGGVQDAVGVAEDEDEDEKGERETEEATDEAAAAAPAPAAEGAPADAEGDPAAAEGAAAAATGQASSFLQHREYNSSAWNRGFAVDPDVGKDVLRSDSHRPLGGGLLVLMLVRALA